MCVLYMGLCVCAISMTEESKNATVKGYFWPCVSLTGCLEAFEWGSVYALCMTGFCLRLDGVTV